MFNINKRKEQAKKEVELYKRELIIEADEEILNYRQELIQKVNNLGKKCAEDIAKYEHEFHSTKEERGIELAKLKAEAEYLQKVNDATKLLLTERENEIARLSNIILTFANRPTIQK